MAVEQGTSRIEARTSGDRGDEPWLPVVLAAAGSLAPDAAELWEKALELIPTDHPDRPMVHAHRARTAWACGDNHTALAHAQQALATTDRPDVITRARATIALATMSEKGAHEPPKPADLDALLAQHTSGDTTQAEDSALAVALADQAITEILGGHTRQGTRTAAAVLRLVGPDGDNSRATIPARMALSLGALYDGRIADARSIADRFMAQVSEDSGSTWNVAYAPWAVDGLVWAAAGEHRRALTTITTGRERARDAKLPVVESILDPIEALDHLTAGRWNDAERIADRYLPRDDDGVDDQDSDTVASRMYAPWLLAVKALVAARRDDPASARAALDTLGDQHLTVHGGGHLLSWAQATIARAEGRHDDARLIMRSIDAQVTESGSQVGWMPIALDLIHQEFEVGATARARCRALISRLAAGHGADDTVSAIWHGAHCFASGDLGGLTDAAATLAGSFPLESARFYAGAMIVAHWYGRTASAVQLAERANLGFAQLGATVEQRRLNELLAERDLELPRQAQVPIGLEGLTEEETRIAALICRGHSNAEVAAAVGIALPKVEAMLLDIYTKAGVNDRLRLAALVAAHAPPWARSRDT